MMLLSRVSACACALAFLSLIPHSSAGSCSHLSNCNGQGICDTVNSKCLCYNGWGSETDVALYKAPDCSARACLNEIKINYYRALAPVCIAARSSARCAVKIDDFMTTHTFPFRSIRHRHLSQ